MPEVDDEEEKMDTNRGGGGENIEFDHFNSYMLDHFSGKEDYGVGPLNIQDEAGVWIHADVDSIENYSDSSDLPELEVEEAAWIVGDKDVDPAKVVAWMHWVKKHLDTLETLMKLCWVNWLYSDHEKIKAKYNQIQRACWCLTVKELMALKQLELFTSPYGQDQLWLFELEIEKQK